MTPEPRVCIFSKKNFGYFFLTLVAFEILSHYPNIDSSYWPKENVQGIIDKVFIVAYGLNGYDILFSFRIFLLRVLVLRDFVLIFSHRN